MELTLGRFVQALRAADVAVSPAETLDACRVVGHIGIADRDLLWNALRLTLAKTAGEKAAFDRCFPDFFAGLAVERPLQRSSMPDLDPRRFLADVEGLGHAGLTAVVAAVLDDDLARLSWLVLQHQDNAALDAMRHLRDKSAVVRSVAAALGLPTLDALRSGGGEFARAAALVQGHVMQVLRDHIDQQYRLRVDASGQRALLAAALSANLQQLPPAYHAEVERVVRRLAEHLARRQRRIRRPDRRGLLDSRRMLRSNVAHDGTPVHLHWRRQHREKAAIYLICDISNSVSGIARLLLLLLHELQAVLPKVRSFVFSNRLGEVTGLFADQAPAEAIETAMWQYGRGTTDYGQALVDLHALVGKAINRRSMLIFLGDARSNHFPARADLFRSLARQAGQTWWLTPEPADRWATGDCVLREYAPSCREVLTCNRLADIERFAERLVERARRG